MANSKLVLYGLECSHAAPGPATLVNGVRVCAWCQKPKIITSVIEYEWAASCRNCAFKRWAGISKVNAEIMAAGHSRINGSHTAQIEYSRNPTAVETSRKFRQWQERKAG